MGIVINQSFKNMVTTYLGFGIGAINTLFLFTYFLDREHYGLVSYLLSASNLIWPFMVFGVHSTLIKFFSSYKTRGEQDRLLNLIVITPAIVGLVLGAMAALFYQHLLAYFEGENDLVKPYVWLIFLIAFATAYFEVFFSWSKIYYKSVFGNTMKEVFHRLVISLLLFAYYWQWISISFFYLRGGCNLCFPDAGHGLVCFFSSPAQFFLSTSEEFIPGFKIFGTYPVSIFGCDRFTGPG